jgi:L-ribulose-5-phosphate 4-epimerase
MLKTLREEVLEANLELVRRGLVLYTFGNASGISREDGLVVIKPSGVAYERMTADNLVVTDLDGRIVEGTLQPSSDLATHLALYRAFEAIGGVVHTHSTKATSWAQACREIPCLGTTHADYFYGSVPVTCPMDASAIGSEYEWNTGQAIVECFTGRDPLHMRAVLVAGHGPFCWGKSPEDAAHVAVVLEEIARIAYSAMVLNPSVQPISDALRDKHFRRKHGPDAYYGQK